MRLFSIFILLLLTTALCKGQAFSLRNYGVADGLPSGEVYDIFQDSKGFLWFSTDNGVVQYDGFDFKNFNVADGLPDPVVFETLEDDLGKIWFRTFSGKIAYAENGVIHPYKFNDQLTAQCSISILSSLVPDSLGQVWFTTGHGVWGVFDKSGKFTQHEIPWGYLFYKSIGNLHLTGRMRAPMGVGIRHVLINSSTFEIELTEPADDPKTSRGTVKALTWRGSYYITINNNIFRYDGTTVTRVYRGETAIISLSKDQDDNIWIGFFNHGAVRFDNEKFENPIPLTSLGSNSVTKVLEDHERGLWVSTLENGVYYIPNSDIKHFSLNTDSKVDAVAFSDNEVVTGEYNGTLTRIDAKTKKVTFKGEFDHPILALLRTKNNLWVGSEMPYLLNNLNHKTKTSNFVTVRDFSEDTLGNVWSVDGAGMKMSDQDGQVLFKKFLPGSYRNIAAFDSVLIVGQHTGLSIYDYHVKLIKSPAQLAAFKISEVIRLNKSTFLVATIGNGFLTTRDFDQFSHYLSPARNIYDVVQADSIVWFATEKGVLKTTLRSLQSKEPHYQLITQRNGLLNMQVSHLALANDELFAFYSNSFSVIPTNKQNYINQSPTFYLKSIKVNNQATDNAGNLSLPYDQNNVRIDFGFISFNNQDIAVRYRLSHDQPWNYLSERTIDLFSLSPGQYPIELQYSVDNIRWTYAPQIPAIQISPAWWVTIEFQLSFVVGLIALIYFIFNNRLVIYRQRNETMRLHSLQQQQLIQIEIETLERERNRIAIDLHDSVGTNILATKLNVNRLLKKHQEPESEAIETQFQDTMVEIKEIIYNLSPPGLERYGLATGLKNYIDRIQKSTMVSFSVSTFGRELIDTSRSVPLFRILQELITNSLKHSQSKSIFIHLNSFDDLYNVVYEDRGIGFSMEGNHKGLGLHNIESRVKSINGKMSFESGPFGISYTIDVPINKNNLNA